MKQTRSRRAETTVSGVRSAVNASLENNALDAFLRQSKESVASQDQKPRPPQVSSKLKRVCAHVARKVHQKFHSIAQAFRHFDVQTQGSISFSDFSFTLENLALGLDRELMIQLFNYLDRDGDQQLKYNDFCSLFTNGSQFVEKERQYDQTSKASKSHVSSTTEVPSL